MLIGVVLLLFIWRAILGSSSVSLRVGETIKKAARELESSNTNSINLKNSVSDAKQALKDLGIIVDKNTDATVKSAKAKTDGN